MPSNSTWLRACISAANTGSTSALANHLNFITGLYGPGKWGTFLTNHDQDRVGDVLDFHPGKLRVASQLLLSVPGVPYLYYGEEVGASGTKPDPNIRRPLDWDEVDKQRADPTSLWANYRDHISIRHQDSFYRLSDYTAFSNGALLTQTFVDGGLTSSGFVITNVGPDTLLANQAGISAWNEIAVALSAATRAIERTTNDTLVNPNVATTRSREHPASQQQDLGRGIQHNIH
jgi:alpha-amylase